MSPFINLVENDITRIKINGIVKSVQNVWTMFANKPLDRENSVAQVLGVKDLNFNDTQMLLMS